MSGFGGLEIGDFYDSKPAAFPSPLWSPGRVQSPPQATAPSAPTPCPARPLPQHTDPRLVSSLDPPGQAVLQSGERGRGRVGGAPVWDWGCCDRAGSSLFRNHLRKHILALSTDAGMAVATAAEGSHCSRGWWETQGM